MARKAIFVHDDVFKALWEAKLHYEGVTGAKMTWGAWLYALACGALAVSALAGLKIKCPLCGESGMTLFYSQFEEPGQEPPKMHGTEDVKIRYG